MSLCVTSVTTSLISRVCEERRIERPSTAFIHFVGDQLVSPISSLPSSDIRGERVLDKAFITVTAICKTYFNAQIADSKDVLTECANVLIAKYSFLSLSEIGEAFRLAVSGRITGVSFATYNGVLTVPVFIDIVNRYVVLRNQIASLIKAANELEQKEQAENEKKRLMSESLSKEVAAKFETDKLDFPYKEYFDIPEYLGRMIIKLGLIEIEQSVKDAIWEDARMFAPNDLIRLKSLMIKDAPSGSIGMMAIRAVANQYEDTPENLKRIAQITYSQLIYYKACNGLI